MAVSLTHTTVAVGTDAGNGEIRKAQWNEGHTLTAAANSVLARTAATGGAVSDVALSASQLLGRGSTGDVAAIGVSSDLSISGTTLGVGANVATLSGAQTFSGVKTFSRIVMNDGYTEEVFAITDGVTVNLDPNNGSIQTWTLGASRTPGQANWASGQSITLLIDDGTASSIVWTTLGVTWKTNGGSQPTLLTTGLTVIQLWKVGTTIYGARVGDA